MYAKCGALGKAKELLQVYKSRDAFSWTALIAGYAHQGQGQQALDCFEQMQHEGLSADAVTFSSVLKACGCIRATELGEKLHGEISRQGLLESNFVLGGALVDMYAKCGALKKAQQVLEELPIRNVIAWSALISGYAQHNQGEQALQCFERMQQEGLCPNAVTFLCILKACGSIHAVDKGDEIHDQITGQGLLERNEFLGNALVDMYAKCGSLAKAERVLEELPHRGVVSWNTLIAGHAEQGQGEKAWSCLKRMKGEGIYPDASTYACMLKVCSIIRKVEEGEQVHQEIVEHGLQGQDMVLSNALVDMYAKCGALDKARLVLEDLPTRDVVSWSALISGYALESHGELALACFKLMKQDGCTPNEVTFLAVLKACGSIGATDKGELFHNEIVRQGLLGKSTILGNALVDMYAKCGALFKSQRVLEELPVQDVAAWNSLITGYTLEGQGEQALNCFKKMHSEGIFPDAVTFLCIVRASGSIGEAENGEQVHCEIVRLGLLCDNVELGNALVNMYANCGAIVKARGVLEELSLRDIVSWNAVITGYAQEGLGHKALDCLNRMQQEGLYPEAITFSCILKACGSIGAADMGEEFHSEVARQGLLAKNTVLGNAVVGMYANCGLCEKARHVLQELPARDIVSWNALITGYVEHGQGERALECVQVMQCEGVALDTITFSCLLKACGSIGAADKGEHIHDEVARQELLESNVLLGTAVVDMYAKCGALAKAQLVLEELPHRNVATWNALIGGYAHEGRGGCALNCFQHMQCEGLSPNAVSLLCVLNACSHLRLADHAETYFYNMSRNFGIKADLGHFTCMVDLFARAGHIEKAVAMIDQLPSWDYISGHIKVIWSAFLGACNMWEDKTAGKWAFEHAIQVNKKDALFYLCMANIYSATGMPGYADICDPAKVM